MSALIKTIISLRNMIAEMNKKELEIKRISKTASLLVLSGLSPNSIPTDITSRIIKEQQADGGWKNIVETFWCVVLLKFTDEKKYDESINRGIRFIESNETKTGLWGRSNRDMQRIPVSGVLLWLLPELATEQRLIALEKLWKSEQNSIVYKAGYTLLAFNQNNYIPTDQSLIPSTCQWLAENQREDGGFAPWIDHPVDADVFCTAIASIGLFQYQEHIAKGVLQKSNKWLITNRLKTGIWKYHEIEDGASWGLYALSLLQTNNK
ncbi:MAG: hypothetical protein GQ564_06040 [Bacteroidales bacterium]|nr:hypothetical protein [Bacteroidales bacterium]